MLLRDLIQTLPTMEVVGPVNRPVLSLARDPWRVTPGAAYFALDEAERPDDQRIPLAVRRGAAAVVCAPGQVVPHRATRVIVHDPREALARAAAEFFREPVSHLQVIGIAGDESRPVLAFFLRQLLASAGAKVGLIGTLRYEAGDRVIPASDQPLEALDIQEMLAATVRSGCRACLVEITPQLLEPYHLEGVRLDTVIETRLAQADSAQSTGDLPSAAVPSLWSGSPSSPSLRVQVRLQPGSRFTEEPGLCVAVEASDGRGITVRGRRRPEAPGGLNLEFGCVDHSIPSPDSSAGLRCRNGWGATLLRCPAGALNVKTALGALGTVHLLGMAAPDSILGLQQLEAAPGFLEPVGCGDPFSVYVDQASTPSQLRRVLSELRETVPGRLRLTFGCREGTSPAHRLEMGQVAATLSDQTLITSDDPGLEAPERIAAEIARGFHQLGRNHWHVELDRRLAIERLIRTARKGDAVVIAGKGQHTQQVLADTVLPFDDRVYAELALEQAALLASG